MDKRCYACKQVKPINQFSRSSSKPDGYNNRRPVHGRRFYKRLQSVRLSVQTTTVVALRGHLGGDGRPIKRR
jgi:hypothetical protein